MKFSAIFFAQLCIAHFAFVIGQTGTECTPDPCEVECSRYLNAICISNTEDCSARFMWRGEDVTERCFNVRTCDTRRCGRNRDCMESVFPSSCAPGESDCRQYIRTSCMLRPPSGPLSCNDIECDDGLMCRFRERVEGFLPVVRCVPFVPSDCSELTCDEGFECVIRGRRPSCVPIVTTPEPIGCSEIICNNNEICIELSNAPICVPLTTSVTPFPTSTTPNTMITGESCDQLDCLSFLFVCNQMTETFAICEPARECIAEFNATCLALSLVCDITSNSFATCIVPSSCNQLTCNENQNCFEFNFGGQTTAQCVDSGGAPMIGLRCEDLTCPNGQGCVFSSYPSINISVASCVNDTILNSIIASTQFLNTCSDVECSPGTVCIDVQMDENSVTASCLPQMCSDDSDCGESSQCVLLTSLQLTGVPGSICTPRELLSRVSNKTCRENERICPEGTVCQEAYINETLIGTICNVPATIGETCNEVECVEENTGCVVNSIPRMPEIPQSASCLNDFDQVTMGVILGLRILGLIE